MEGRKVKNLKVSDPLIVDIGRTMCKVSVITGYYNRKSRLRPTIESLLAQTFTDFELIVFDDASQDGTAEELRRLEAEYADPRLKVVINPESTGFVQGLIDHIAPTRGEYIAIQGSGDVSHPKRLERQVEVLESRPNVGTVGSWYYNVLESDGSRRLRKPDASKVDHEYLMKRGNVFSHGEVMYRRELYDKIGGYRAAFVNCQDLDLWLRMIHHADFATVREPLYDRYIQRDGVSYHPRKVGLQMQYSLLARIVATMDTDEAEYVLKRTEKEGPGWKVPPTAKQVQRRYFHASLRSTLWGEVEDGRDIAVEHIINPVVRSSLVAVARMYDTRLASVPRWVVRRTLGIENSSLRATSRT